MTYRIEATADQIEAINRGENVVLSVPMHPQPDVAKRRHRWAIQLDGDGVLRWGRAPWRKSDPYNFVIENGAVCPVVEGDRVELVCRVCVVIAHAVSCTHGDTGATVVTITNSEAGRVHFWDIEVKR